jgi:[acyl-carrier-protein] S-malonyltransferase
VKAVLFPGQGSQKVGMGQELLASNGAGAELMRQADAIFDGQLLPVMLEGPMDVLTQTKWTQPAIFVHSMALWREYQPDDGFFSVTAGHSLGEYGSLVAAGVLSFEEALYLVKKRGELMQQAGENQPGTMAAVLGLEDKIVESICTRVSRDSHHVVPANYNSTGQIVLSGHISAVHEAMELLQTEGAKMVKELTVGGAFHSPLMQSAEAELATAMDEVVFRPANMDVFSNVTGKASRDPEELKVNLLSQLTGAVRWTQTMESMHGLGVDSITECGPGVVLQKMWKRSYPETTIEPL